jgi:hypothetical protein
MNFQCSYCGRSVDRVRGPSLCYDCFHRQAKLVNEVGNLIRRSMFIDGPFAGLLPHLPPDVRARIEQDQQQRYWSLSVDLNEPEPCTFGEWALCMTGPYCVVGLDRVGPVNIYTRFRGMDMRPGATTPQFWETVLTGPNTPPEKHHCGGSRADALAMHRTYVLRLADSFGIEPPELTDPPLMPPDKFTYGSH